MIDYERFTLDNGLKVLLHEDRSTNLAAINLLYDVGARDEDPEHTGLAHLLEHLMFTGTVEVPVFDIPLQMAGGENNAFTNNDITNYYITVPSVNFETGLWLESDRMTGLRISEKSLEVQKNVVIQEFNQRYLNQPYGDSMLILRQLAYKIHPYQWPTIGRNSSHIAQLTPDRIKDFYLRYYSPANAILSVTGNIDPVAVRSLVEKWFGHLPKRNITVRNLPEEPVQAERREISVRKNVPVDSIYKAWHICQRKSDDFHTLDLLTDLLAGGESGRLHSKLVREKNIFSEINAYLTSEIDPGLLIISGKLMKGIVTDEAEQSLKDVLDELKKNLVPEDEIEKVRNKFESSLVLANTSVLNKAMNLAYYELLGDASEVNNEAEKYRAVGREAVLEAAGRYLTDDNCSTVYYLSETAD